MHILFNSIEVYEIHISHTLLTLMMFEPLTSREAGQIRFLWTSSANDFKYHGYQKTKTIPSSTGQGNSFDN